MSRLMRDKIIFAFVIIGLVLIVIYIFSFLPSTVSYTSDGLHAQVVVPGSKKEIPFTPHYVQTPQAVKAIYMTSWMAGIPRLRDPLIKLIDNSELNSVVIDVKDYTGKIFFAVQNPDLKKFGSEEIRIADLPQFLDSLHQKGVYTIARIVVFQDAYFVKLRPDLAVKNLAGTAIWKDYKGISWIDPGAHEYWDYIVLIGKEARAAGFDELNFDYIRFPSDGNMQDISYPFSSTTPRTLVLKNFFEYLHDNFSSRRLSSGTEISGNVTDKGVKISVDLFGLTTVADDDMGIGQVLTDALPYFDYVAPMVYPSHFASGFDNFKNPAEHPYDVVFKSMSSAVSRANQTIDFDGASTTPAKLRPWLQDFSLGANYGVPEVQAEKKATYDVGLNSWMLWSATNIYTIGALNAQ